MKSSKPRNTLLAEFDAAPDWARFDQITLAAVRGCSIATCERDRWAGTGVPFVRDGRRVCYIKRDILEYLNRQARVQSTSAADAA